MQAREIELPGIGEPETLRVRTRELPVPKPGEASIKVEASGVSFAEQQMRRGKYYDQPDFPFVPGYDLVGIDEETGTRVAALTKVGGWADRVILEKADLVPVPDGVSAEAAETVIVNGVTAYRMLHRSAKVQPGQTIVVHGAAGGVGTVLVQLARHAGIHVIGTAGPTQQQRLRDLGVTPIDYRSEDVPARVKELAPDGVAAVFDHVGGSQIDASWRMLARGGTLVSYGTASTKDVAGNPQVPVLKLLAKLTVWNLLPNGKSASFFNLWAGRRFRKDRFRRQLRDDLGHVLELVRDGAVAPQIAARFGLEQAAEALRFAEAGGNTGKVLILPQERSVA
jgi:NADPH:quinone reductase-like Zn-dependent oxidoreductase